MNDNFETVFESICKEIESSEYGLLKICKNNGIGYNTFVDYLKNNDSAQIRYARAKETQVETLIEKIKDIQEECLNEIRTIEDPKRVNAIQNAYKEQVRHIEWIASKLKAKTYGDKLDITSNGNDITREILITPISNTTKPAATSQDSQVQ